MSYGAIAAATAGASAARRQRMQQEKEEEEMTQYTRDDLDDDWEFKIVRSSTAAFRKRETLDKLLEEGGAGTGRLPAAGRRSVSHKLRGVVQPAHDGVAGRRWVGDIPGAGSGAVCAGLTLTRRLDHNTVQLAGRTPTSGSVGAASAALTKPYWS